MAWLPRQAAELVSSNYVRGLLSGFGLMHLWRSVLELDELLRGLLGVPPPAEPPVTEQPSLQGWQP